MFSESPITMRRTLSKRHTGSGKSNMEDTKLQVLISKLAKHREISGMNRLQFSIA